MNDYIKMAYHSEHSDVNISFVIPVFNADYCLHELYRRLVETMCFLNLSFEIILVEDCGNDNSWSIILEIAAQDDRVRGYKLSRNFGQHNAITAGLDQVRGDWIVIMDCDLQDRPEDVGRLIEKTHEGYDLVIARIVDRRGSLAKRVTSDLFYSTLSWLSGYRYEKGVRPFRIMSRDVLQSLRLMQEQTRTLGPLMEWVGYNSTYVDVDFSPRYAGSSSYSWGRLMKLASGTLLAYSDKPLRLSIGVGFIMAGCAFIYGIFIVIRALIDDIPVPGWTSLITSLYFIGGLILANLGVVGVYIGMTFNEAKKRPLYLIARRTNSDGIGDMSQVYSRKE